jgi:hypothetical protein
LKMSSRVPASSGSTSKTLAQVLAAGPVALSAAMQYAIDVAAALREIHEQGRTHGKVVAGNVAIPRAGVELLPCRNTWDRGDAARDTREFGALLYHLLTGSPLPPGELPEPAGLPAQRTGRAGLRTSALQVAAACFGEGGFQPTMQQVLIELRLLAVLLKMPEKGEPVAPPAKPVPFLVVPPHQRAATPFAPPAPVLAGNPHELAGESGATPLVPLGPGSFGQPSAKAPAEVAKRGGRCPKCDCGVVYVARARSRFEQVLERLRVPICRCHRCYHRYLVFSRFRIRKEMPVGSARKQRPHRRKP